MSAKSVTINRAPVLTLWGAVVAERLGYDEDAALSLGRCLAGLNAQTKARSLGLYEPPKTRDGSQPSRSGLGEEYWVTICGRPLPAKDTVDGVRAVIEDKPIEPEVVRKYLASRFGARLSDVKEAMTQLARACEVDDLDNRAYELYETFRPRTPAGFRGWGAKGELDLDLIRSLAIDAQDG